MTFQVTIMFLLWLGYFCYERLIRIFLMVFWQPFRTSEIPTQLLYFYIDIYLFVKWKHIQMAPSKHIDLSLCWLNVVSLSVKRFVLA